MFETILFDLDGTLTDPKQGITKCVQYALAKKGIQVDDLDKLIPFIGPPLLWSFKEFYGLSEVEAKEAIEFYRERFVKLGMYENVVYPGIEDMLKMLKQQGKRLIVATSKPTVYSITILEHFRLNGYFDAIVGSNLDGTRIEKEEVIEFALSELEGLDLDKLIMVGDRRHDIIGARKNGLSVIAVAYGYGSLEELKKAEPDYIVSTVKELEEMLTK